MNLKPMRATVVPTVLPLKEIALRVLTGSTRGRPLKIGTRRRRELQAKRAMKRGIAPPRESEATCGLSSAFPPIQNWK